ncbi:MAG: 50S ribosomal protein L19 [Planctomycetes bacterium]|nr:50S ribosomal protein L19 [Planctomycetota bacterium]
MNPIIALIEKENFRKTIPAFDIGDTVDVHVKIIEGDKERVQVYTGTVISRKGSGTRSAFTVRRIVQGEGVERVFPLHSPKIVDVVVKKHGRVRRAKLYYLRGRVGKGTKVKEKAWEKETVAGGAGVPAKTPEPATPGPAPAKA